MATNLYNKRGKLCWDMPNGSDGILFTPGSYLLNGNSTTQSLQQALSSLSGLNHVNVNSGEASLPVRSSNSSNVGLSQFGGLLSPANSEVSVTSSITSTDQADDQYHEFTESPADGEELFPSQTINTALTVTPYTDATKPKKPSKNNKVRRPMNAFMVFAQQERRRISETEPDLHNAVISKRLGEMWRNMKEEERRPYHAESQRLTDFHRQEFPDYKYQPQKKKKGGKGGKNSSNDDVYNMNLPTQAVQASPKPSKAGNKGRRKPKTEAKETVVQHLQLNVNSKAISKVSQKKSTRKSAMKEPFMTLRIDQDFKNSFSASKLVPLGISQLTPPAHVPASPDNGTPDSPESATSVTFYTSDDMTPQVEAKSRLPRYSTHFRLTTTDSVLPQQPVPPVATQPSRMTLAKDWHLPSNTTLLGSLSEEAEIEKFSEQVKMETLDTMDLQGFNILGLPQPDPIYQEIEEMSENTVEDEDSLVSNWNIDLGDSNYSEWNSLLQDAYVDFSLLDNNPLIFNDLIDDST